ncbi:MAG: NINE protein [Clostridia bacterium]|nr:NINE protein [Clostridia bacterium]
MKNKTLALILSILLGGLGVDRFYLGYIGIGVLKLLTGGCFGILYIVDIVYIATGKLKPADGSPYEDDSFSGKTEPSRSSDPYGDLEKLAVLHKDGVLTDEEFAKMKAECLSRM